MTTAPARVRRRLNADERREQLMAAAVEVLAADGFRAATADAIVARAGVSKGLLWHYFDDLDDLLRQTARRTVMVIARAVGRELDLLAPIPEVIRAAIHAAARIPTTYAAEHRALQCVVPNLRSADGSPQLTAADYAELHAAQEGLFRRGQTEGTIDPRLDPRILAVTYQATVDAMIAHLTEHPELDPDRGADQFADALLGGFVVEARAAG